MSRKSFQKISIHCNEISHLLKFLAHPQRLLILSLLVDKAKNVSVLEEQCNISQSQLSQFLARMRLEGLLNVEKKGNFHFYSIKDQRIKILIKNLEKLFCN